VLRRIGGELLHAARGSVSREIRDRVELAARLQHQIASPRRIVVAGTQSGAGCATLTGLIGLTLAYHRLDRVVLVDGHPGPVRTLDRLGAAAGCSFGDLARMENPPARFDEVRPWIAATRGGLYALSAAAGPDRWDAGAYDAGVAALSRYFSVAVFGCGVAPTYELVAGAHALLLVTPATHDGAADLRRRLIWLHAQGLSDVVARTIAVFVSPTPGRRIDVRAESAALTEMGVATASLPFDRRLAAAAELAPDRLSDPTRAAALTITAEALTRATSRT
jgi:MinD-like ATPase involved in chromosome partitioning or flagellar assembly